MTVIEEIIDFISATNYTIGGDVIISLNVEASDMALRGGFVAPEELIKKNFEKLLPQIKVPTVCLNYSKNGNVAGIKKAASIIQSGKYEYLEDASPYINRANPELFASLFLEYFK